MKKYAVLAAILLVAGTVMGATGVSNTVYLIVNAITGPSSGIAFTTQPVVMMVNVTGNTPFTYQWQKNGGDIPSATDSTYTIASAAMSDAGDYDCVATSAGGLAITSSTATLTVLQTLTITEQPANATRNVGEGYTFTMAAIGDGTLFYQWYKNGTEVISGATTASYSIAACVLGDAGDYHCDVTDNNPTVVPTNAAALAVLPLGVEPELKITFDSGAPGQLSPGVFNLHGADFLSIFQNQAGVASVAGSIGTVNAIVIRLVAVPVSVFPPLAGIPADGDSAAVTFADANITTAYNGLILVGFRFVGGGTTNYYIRNDSSKVVLTYGGTGDLAASSNGWTLNLTAPL